MNEPTRLKDAPQSALERSLLDAGRSYRSSDATRRRALSALGLASVTATTSAAASTLTQAALVKWAVAGVVLAGGAFTTLHFRRAPQVEAPRAPLVAPVPAPSPPPTNATPPAAAPADPVPLQSASAPLPSAVALPRPASPSLSAELNALDAARASLSAGNPSAALSALDSYARVFPHGKLAIEAEVLRIDALAKSGQTAAARKRAEAFVQRHPDSVLASRVRSSIGR